MQKRNYPNFIIIGAMKAATTSLYTYLRQHPEIFMSTIKEPMFFNRLKEKSKGSVENEKKLFNKYLKLFEKVKNETAIGEASPAYIYNEDCAKLIKNYLPKVKIIVVLRQPAERAYSNYLHALRAGKEPLTNFEKALSEESKRMRENWGPLFYYKDKGYYYKQLKRYYDVFPEESIKVLLFDDILNKPQSILIEVFKFLKLSDSVAIDVNKKSNVSGLPKGILGWIATLIRKYNITKNIEFSRYFPESVIKWIVKKIYKKPDPIKKELVKKLTNKYYKEDILKLEKLIGRSLSHWIW